MVNIVLSNFGLQLLNVFVFTADFDGVWYVKICFLLAFVEIISFELLCNFLDLCNRSSRVKLAHGVERQVHLLVLYQCAHSLLLSHLFVFLFMLVRRNSIISMTKLV